MSGSFRFATAISGNPNLYKAISKVVSTVEQQLGNRSVDFCQLLVTTEHRRNLAHAPEVAIAARLWLAAAHQTAASRTAASSSRSGCDADILACCLSFLHHGKHRRRQCLLDHLHRSPQASAARQQQQGARHAPTVIGGAVQAVGGDGRTLGPGCAGVSLLAASLPGVQLMPFHVSSPSLPALTAQQWERLLSTQQQQQQRHGRRHPAGRSSGVGEESARHRSAAILLSSPHFIEVERLLSRLSNILPGLPIVGGVTESNAWLDTENSYGALFLNGTVFASGAVGVILNGPGLALRQLLLPAGRPAGDIMTVTQAVGNSIHQLDHAPVRESFVSLLHSLDDADQRRELQLGLELSHATSSSAADVGGADGSSSSEDQGPQAEPSLWHQQHPFAARAMSMAAGLTGQPVLRVATADVPEGTPVQLQVRDFQLNWQQQQQALQDLALRLSTRQAAGAAASESALSAPQPQAAPAAAAATEGPEAAGPNAAGPEAGGWEAEGREAAGLEEAPALSGGSELCLLGYCCVGLPQDEAALVQELLPRVPFAGGRMQGEFGGAGQLHSYAASYALLCRSDADCFGDDS